MEYRPLLGWSLFLAGAAALGAGIAFATQKKGVEGVKGLRGALGKGRLVDRAYPTTPVVEEYTSSSGMKVQHRRSENMPIEERVANIQDMVWKSLMDPEMRKLALAVTNHCPERDDECEARAIYKAIKKRIRYTGDVAPVKVGGSKGPVEPIDLYQTARRTWEFKGGDCDDHNTLASTLLSLNGIPARLRVTADSAFADYGHIYVVAGLPKMNPKRWIALDTTLPGDKRFGVEVPYSRNLDFRSHTKNPSPGTNGASRKGKKQKRFVTDYPA